VASAAALVQGAVMSVAYAAASGAPCKLFRSSEQRWKDLWGGIGGRTGAGCGDGVSGRGGCLKGAPQAV
jgi:hypothetical protein